MLHGKCKRYDPDDRVHDAWNNMHAWLLGPKLTDVDREADRRHRQVDGQVGEGTNCNERN